MEAVARSIVEATSWMDWWTCALRSLAMKSIDDGWLVLRMSLAGARCQFLVAKTASTLWANIILKRRDAVLANVKDSMDLRNSFISTGDELFPNDVLQQAVEKSSKIVHDEAIHKAVTLDKPSSRGKKLQFSSLPHKPQGLPPKKSTGSSSDMSSRQSATKSSSSKTLLPPAGGGERSFENSSPPS